MNFIFICLPRLLPIAFLEKLGIGVLVRFTDLPLLRNLPGGYWPTSFFRSYYAFITILTRT
jgi:hypothetical protein